MRAIVIPHDAGTALRVQELHGVGAFQEAVGGWIEPKEIPQLHSTLYVNGAGLEKRLPFNSRATALWLFHAKGRAIRPTVLGDVVLTGSGRGGDQSDDISPFVEQMLLGEVTFVMQSQTGGAAWHNTSVRFDNFFDTAIWCMLYADLLREGPLLRIAVDHFGAVGLDAVFEGDPRW